MRPSPPLTILMPADEIWSDWFDPPFARHGEKILAAVLGLAVVLSGAGLAWLQVDTLLTAGQDAFAAILGGAFAGAIVGLPLLALGAFVSRRLRSSRDVAVSRVVIGFVMFGLSAGAFVWFVVPLLRAEPGSLLQSASSAQVWVRAAGLGLGATVTVVLLSLVPLAQGFVALARRAASGAPPPSAPAHRRRPDLERTLTQIALTGLVAAVFLLIYSGILLLSGLRMESFVLAGVAVLLAVSHGSAKWWPWGLTWARAAWWTLAAAALWLLWPTPLPAIVAVVVTAGAGIYLGTLAPRLAAYLRGELEEPEAASEDATALLLQGHACEVCSARGCGIVAPVWCVSLLVVTSRRLGRPRILCRRHARWNGLPATLTSAALGWWGLPWGLVWTPTALWQNLSEGGVVLDRPAALRALQEQQEGPLAIRSPVVAVLGLGLILLLVYTLLWR